LQAPVGQVAGQQPADSSGHFEFDYVAKKDYTLLVTADGYQPATQDVDPRFGNQLFLTIRLAHLDHKVKENRGAVTSVEGLKVPAHAKRQYAKGDQAFKAQNYSATLSITITATEHLLTLPPRRVSIAQLTLSLVLSGP
jgi:hypothetical protein